MTRFLREHDLPEGAVERRGEVLGRLERQLPSGFPDMVADQEFTSLIDGLVALPRSGELLLRLREGAALPAAVRPEPVAYSAPPRPGCRHRPGARRGPRPPARTARCCGVWRLVRIAAGRAHRCHGKGHTATKVPKSPQTGKLTSGISAHSAPGVALVRDRGIPLGGHRLNDEKSGALAYEHRLARKISL
ncbi:hypothetical protein [Streptomyces angustmyceticus]|uniref:hypothetical protein n=1 Tax=Streptomyces angustmyceticus TaxID=285578 RepID=UPI00344BA060